ncbi:MAG: class I tRNA ligase family protein, partial [Geminicoccaceae bacterium]
AGTAPDRHRTAIALELATAALLVAGTAAIMPRFAGKLAASLGIDLPVCWPEAVTLIGPSSSIGLADATFFIPIDPELGASAINTAAE